LTLHFLNFCPGENIAENSQKAHEVAKTDGVRQHSHTKWRQEICQKQHIFRLGEKRVAPLIAVLHVDRTDEKTQERQTQRLVSRYDTQ
jgi:hypothetical protein